MSRPALFTRRHVEELQDHSDLLDGYGALLDEVMADGHVDPSEQRLLLLRFDVIELDGEKVREGGERIDTNASFADRAMHGDGVYSPWFRQMARQHAKDQLYLVVKNDDPTPDGPVGKKKAA